MPKSTSAKMRMDFLLNISKTMDYAFHDGYFNFFESSEPKARELPTWDGNGTGQDFTEPCFFREKKTVGFVHGFAVYLGSSAILGRSASSKAKCKIFANNCLHALDIVRQLCGNRMLKCFFKTDT